jgi:hypothetical protein
MLILENIIQYYFIFSILKKTKTKFLIFPNYFMPNLLPGYGIQLQ